MALGYYFSMLKKKKRDTSFLPNETHTARLKRLYGDQILLGLEPSNKETLVVERAQERSLTTLHPLDDDRDPLSPPSREGRRIAGRREDRDKSFLMKLTPGEHDSIRRVASWYGYSMSHTVRILIRERERALWPNEDDMPNLLQLDMDASKRKEEAARKTDKWIQKRRNALQRREEKLRQEVEWAQTQQAKLKAREDKASSGVKELEKIRADKRAGTRQMRRVVDAEQLNSRETLKENIADVEVALLDESIRLGRPLTDSEKWEVGKRVRTHIGSKIDVELEKAIETAILDVERKKIPKRKLTVKERWEVRKKVRARLRTTLLHK